MHVAGRMAAALFLALFAAHWAISDTEAASRAKTDCARAPLASKSCHHASRGRAGAKRASYRQRTRPGRILQPARSRKLYRGNEAAVAQLSSKLRPRRAFTWRFDSEARNGCGQSRKRARGPRRACVSQIGLPEALIQPGNAATERTLRELGIPIIPDVPPIVILDPTSRNPDDLHPLLTTH